MSESVLVRTEGAVGVLTLNRPKALHSLNTEMCDAMIGPLLKWQDDPSIELVMIEHADGTRGFCAGGDISMLAASGKTDGKAACEFFAIEYQLNDLLQSYEKPVIAIIDGVTMGGGVGISVHGTYRVATENTVFAMPESGIGLFPDVGGGWFLPRLEGELGMWLALTGARLKGKDVLAAGVATHFISAEKLSDLKSQIFSNGVDALEGLQTDATGSFSVHQEVVDRTFDKDSVPAILSALTADGSDWAIKQKDTIDAKCPFTCVVAHRQLREGGKLTSFADNMRMEYRIGARMVMRPDFHEGVRAVIIDKDNAPKWSPATFDGIDPSDVDDVFSPLAEGDLKLIGEE